MKNQIKNYTESILYIAITLGVFSMVGRLLVHIVFNDARSLLQTISGAFSMFIVFAFLLFCMWATISLIVADIKERHNA
jgi:hypothetical protein